MYTSRSDCSSVYLHSSSVFLDMCVCMDLNACICTYVCVIETAATVAKHASCEGESWLGNKTVKEETRSR